jgi:transcriptional regulator with XRE-family HTH domain
MTQAQLAEATDLSLEMIGRLERGVTTPSFETIAALTAALQVPVAALFGAEPGETEGERGQVVARIRDLLARYPDRDLRRVERVLAALLSD